MTKQEFQDRTGLQVTDGEFSRIHAMYMATGLMGMDEFCAGYLASGDSQLVQTLFANLQDLEAQDRDRDRRFEEYKRSVADCARELISYSVMRDVSSLYDMAAKLLGRKDAILTRLELGYSVEAADLGYLKSHLS